MEERRTKREINGYNGIKLINPRRVLLSSVYSETKTYTTHIQDPTLLVSAYSQDIVRPVFYQEPFSITYFCV